MGDRDSSESPESLELFHYGVKGMKWGVRREKGSGGRVKKAAGKVKRGFEEPARRVKAGQIRRNNENLKVLKKGLSDSATLEDSYNLGKKITMEEILQFGGPHRAARQKVSTLTRQNERLKSGKETYEDIRTAYSNVTISDLLTPSDRE